MFVAEVLDLPGVVSQGFDFPGALLCPLESAMSGWAEITPSWSNP
jgi:predicted RNase H-like HicB family nuclease